MTIDDMIDVLEEIHDRFGYSEEHIEEEISQLRQDVDSIATILEQLLKAKK